MYHLEPSENGTNENNINSSEPQTVRRSTRENFGVPPQRYGEWAKLATDLKQLHSREVKIPTTYDEAIRDTRFSQYWQDATNEEIKSLMEHQVFEIVDEDPAKKPITTKWVFDIKKKQMV